MLSKTDEHTAAFLHLILEDISRQTVRPMIGNNIFNNPKQLPSNTIKPNYDYLIPPKLCITKAYRSTANPTSNRSTLLSHKSQ